MRRVRLVVAGLIAASALGACLPGVGIDLLCLPGDPDQPVWVPAVDASGASDVSGPMADFLATVPDGSTIELRAGGTYRMEQGFSIAGRRNLTILGNGATFVATSTGVSTRVSVRIEDSSGIAVFDLRVVGANPMAGAKDNIFRPELAGQHGFGISRSTNVRALRCQRHRHLRRLRVHGSLGWRRVHGRSAHPGQRLRSQRSAGHHLDRGPQCDRRDLDHHRGQSVHVRLRARTGRRVLRRARHHPPQRASSMAP